MEAKERSAVRGIHADGKELCGQCAVENWPIRLHSQYKQGWLPLISRIYESLCVHHVEREKDRNHEASRSDCPRDR